MIQSAKACAHLEDCHPERIYICARGGELFQEISREPESVRVYQLWCHPPNRAPRCTAGSGISGGRFIDSHRKPKVGQASAIFGVNEDVILVSIISIYQYDQLCGDQGLTPFRSPWIIPCSCRYFNPVAAPTSYVRTINAMGETISFLYSQAASG